MTAREDIGPSSRSNQRLSPERIRGQEFTRTSLGRRGYNEDEVRGFIGRVAEDMAASDAEKASLRAEIDRLRRRYREQNNSPDTNEGPPADAVNLLSAAQQQADAYVAQAQEYCRQLTDQARQQADDILVEARDQAGAAADEAAHGYRKRSGSSYDADLEEMERRVAWIQTFCRAVQIQMQAASDAFSTEIARLSDFTAAPAATAAAEDSGDLPGASHRARSEQQPPAGGIGPDADLPGASYRTRSEQEPPAGGVGPDADLPDVPRRSRSNQPPVGPDTEPFYQHRHGAPPEQSDRSAGAGGASYAAWPQQG